jgi:regulation of enolase protein 1 (concanavalin A-like superfamily)
MECLTVGNCHRASQRASVLVIVFCLCSSVIASTPAVTLSTPDDGATYIAPATLFLSASAADASATVTNVSFYSGTTLLASVASPPYSFTWSNVPPGAYTLSATATNDAGVTGTSNLVHVTVNVASPATALNVLTQRYDNSRTGANLAESALTTTSVNAQQFGKLFSRAVDGNVYAQPLYVSGVNFGASGAHNIIVVATEHNSVYAFDADDPNAAAPLWQAKLGTPSSSADVLCGRLVPEIGVTGTPVIDLPTNTLYVVNKTKANGKFFNSLHALDLTSGTEKLGGPVTITATVPGTGDGSSGGMLTFDPLRNYNHAGLLLVNGVVYIAFAAHCDLSPNHGWIFGYDALTLAQKSVLNLTPTGSKGAVFQCGNGLAADANGSIYVMTGSGTSDAGSGGSNYGSAFLKLLPSGGSFSVQSYFVPKDVAALNANDLDVGSGGPLLIPGTNLLVGGGKSGTLYVLDRTTLGGFDPNTDHVVQELPGVGAGGENNPCTAYWNGPGGPFLYVWSGNDTLKSYRFGGSTFQTTPASKNSNLQSLPAGALSLSANGGAAGSGILWGVHNQNGTGVLRAFDAADVSHELWNSEQNSARDSHGSFAELSVPTVANGKVYAATFSNRIDVYGLIPPGLHINISSPSPGTVFGAPSNIPISVNVSDTTGTVTRVDYYNGSTLIGSSNSAPFSIVWNNVPAGSYSISAKVTDNTSATATSGTISISVSNSGGALPAPWQHQDIGGVGVAGSATFANGVFTVSGSGTDIWGGQDEYHSVFQPLTGDGQITARIASMQNTNSWAKGGVMICQTPVDDSVNAFMGITPGAGSIFQRRTSTGVGTVSTQGPAVAPPYWIRVVRSGSTFTGYVSKDGANWTQVGSDTLSMSAQVYVALVLSAHDNTVLNTSTFDSVSVATVGSGNKPPTVTLTAPTDGATFASPASISLRANAADSDGTISRVDFFNGSTLIGSSTNSPYSATWSNVAAGTYTISAIATDNNGATGASNTARITVTGTSGGSLPSPWLEQDIGSPALTGSSSYSSGQFTIRGSGVDIWNGSDQFHYIYQALNGNGTIIARVASIQNTDSWAKAGVMIRQSLSADSAHAFVTLTAGNGSNFHRRTAAGLATVNTSGPAFSAPYWVRLVRSNATFTASVSSDGANWVQVGSDTLSMPSSVYIGLALTSHNPSALNTSTFDSVTVQSSGANTPPTVSITAPQDNAVFTTVPATVSIQAAATDSDGTVSRVDFYNGSTLLGSATNAPYSYSWNNVSAGSYTLSAVAVDNLSASTTSSPIHISVGSSGGGLPAPWSDKDVGSVGVAGSASYSSGTFTVNGSGADIWNSADGFNFVSQALSGDLTVTARVTGIQQTDSWAKAGVMIRQNLQANSAHAMMVITPGNGSSFQRRTTADAVSTGTAGTSVTAPYWVRLVRRSNTITAYQSSDGNAWTQVGSDTVVMSGTVYVGLSVTAHNNAALNTATFTNVSVTTP